MHQIEFSGEISIIWFRVVLDKNRGKHFRAGGPYQFVAFPLLRNIESSQKFGFKVVFHIRLPSLQHLICDVRAERLVRQVCCVGCTLDSLICGRVNAGMPEC